MFKRIIRWMENVAEDEPKWQEPIEWFSIGFLVAVVVFIGIL